MFNSLDAIFFFEDLKLTPTDDPTTLEVTYKKGPYTYTGLITRQATELEQLRARVSELESQLNPSAPDAI